MGWAKLDDSFHDHPKTDMVSLAAVGLWTLCLTWAHRHRPRRDGSLPGYLPASRVRKFAGDEAANLAAELVEAGLWEDTEGGWVIHDFSHYLPRERDPEERRRAGQRGADTRWRGGTSWSPDGNLPSASHGNLPSASHDVAMTEPRSEPAQTTTEGASDRGTTHQSAPTGTDEAAAAGLLTAPAEPDTKGDTTAEHPPEWLKDGNLPSASHGKPMANGMASDSSCASAPAFPSRPDPKEQTLWPPPSSSAEVTHEKPHRPRDELWDAVMAACGIDPERITRSARGVYNRAVGDLRSIGADPAEVPGRAREYVRRFPTAALTPAALAKHWPQCSAPRPTSRAWRKDP